MGAASARFHRPTSGQGLNNIAQRVIKSMRMVQEASDFFKAMPANHLLQDREPNEAFCRAIEGEEYLVYFPNGGMVLLDVGEMNENLAIRWINLMEAAWQDVRLSPIENKLLKLAPPSSGHGIAFIQAE